MSGILDLEQLRFQRRAIDNDGSKKSSTLRESNMDFKSTVTSPSIRNGIFKKSNDINTRDIFLNKNPLKSKTITLPTQDIEDATGTNACVVRSRTVILDKIRECAGLGGKSSSASVIEFHRYLAKLRHEAEGPFQCLVAAILSVQCTDRVAMRACERLRTGLDGGLRVVSVTSVGADGLEPLIRDVNFFRTKARRLAECAEALVARHSGAVPSSYAALVALPGIGPKIANLVLSVGLEREDAGLVVDTHVHRVSGRLGWASGGAGRVEETRRALEVWIPVEDRVLFTVAVIAFGQRICTPLRPRCSSCPVSHLCPSADPSAATVVIKGNESTHSKIRTPCVDAVDTERGMTEVVCEEADNDDCVVLEDEEEEWSRHHKAPPRLAGASRQAHKPSWSTQHGRDCVDLTDDGQVASSGVAAAHSACGEAALSRAAGADGELRDCDEEVSFGCDEAARKRVAAGCAAGRSRFFSRQRIDTEP